MLPFVPAEHKNRGLGEKKKPIWLSADTIRYLVSNINPKTPLMGDGIALLFHHPSVVF